MKRLRVALAALLFAALPALSQVVQYAPKPCRMDGTDCAPQRVLLGNGTAAAPSYSFSTDATSGWYFTPTTLYAALGGAQSFSLTSTALTIPAGSTFGIAGDTFLSRRGAANWNLGAADAASPVAQTLTVQGARGGTDTNVAGVTETFQGSLGTGTGASGPIVFKAGTPQTTGTAQHVANTVLTLQDIGTAGTSSPQAVFAGGVAITPAAGISKGVIVALGKLTSLNLNSVAATTIFTTPAAGFTRCVVTQVIVDNYSGAWTSASVSFGSSGTPTDWAATATNANAATGKFWLLNPTATLSPTYGTGIAFQANVTIVQGVAATADVTVWGYYE
jgi:hypothetical protein